MRQLAAAAVLALAAAAAAAVAPAAAWGAEFTPSVVLTTIDEMQNNCEQMVWNALALNAEEVKFVPTVHYYGSETHLSSYCYRIRWGVCEAPNKDNIERFTALLARCMQRVIDAGKDIAVLAHLDNMGDYTWRNVLQFSPTEKKAGYSYADVVLAPMARAVNRVMRPGRRVMFTINGETGKSVAQYGAEWLKLVPYTRELIRANKNLGKGDVLVGVSLNYNKMLGWLGFDYIASDYVATSADRQQFAADAKKYPIDLESVRRLYQAVDVIGVSAYPPLYPNFTYSALDTALRYHEWELAFIGVNLKQLVNSGKKLVISEWGLGGGTEDGKGIAANLTMLAAHPFFGLWYPYEPAKDPWRNSQYNDYRRYLYQMTSKWLKNNAGAYRLSKLYVWTAGSWDALGVHWATSGNGGSWADSSIISLVKDHNKGITSRTVDE